MTLRFICLGLLIVSSMLACTNKIKPASNEHVQIQAKPIIDEGMLIQPTVPGEIDTVKKSMKAVAYGRVGDANIKILYHSPAVRGRVIWGGLVPFDQVWATGAHMATAIEVDKGFMLGHRKFDAGKYALFTFPGKDEWIVVINKNWEQHLADDYNVSDDLVRISIKPELVSSVQERLMYRINQVDNYSSNIEFRWDKLKLTIPFQEAAGK